MSGPIRSAIGPLRKKLADNLKLAKDVLIEAPTEDNAAGLVDRYNGALRRLQRSIKGLNSKDAAWTELIQGMDSGETTDKEIQIYEKTVTNGFVPEVIEAESVMEEIEDLLQSVNPNSAVNILRRINRGGDEQQQATADPPPAAHAAMVTNPMVRLPKFDLPKFSGKMSEWQNFWTMFDFMVHSQSIPSVQKFAYLRSSLRGPALEIVAGLPIKDETYQIAIKMLSERYDVHEFTLDSLYRELQLMKLVGSAFSDVRQRCLDIERILQQLEAAGESVNNRWNVQAILSKFNNDTISRIRAAVNQPFDIWDMSKLRSGMKNFIQRTEYDAMQSTDSNSQTREVKDRDGEGKQHKKRGFDSPQQSRKTYGTDTSAFMVTEPSKELSKKPPGSKKSGRCWFCQEDHRTDLCPQYNNLAARQKRARELGLCGRCLNRRHTTAECQTKISCHFCETFRDHCSALCNVPRSSGMVQSKGSSHRSAVGNPGKAPAKSVSSAKDKSDDSEPMGLALCEFSLFQTARAKVQNPATGKTMMARILFDNGAQRSYLARTAVKTLGFTGKKAEKVVMSTFGSKKKKTICSDRVNLNVILRDGSLKPIVVNTTDIISPSFSQRGPLCDQDMEYLKGLQPYLADDLDMMNTKSEVDLLLGADYFWDFTEPRREDLPSGLKLIDSSLGWLLAGRSRFARGGSHPNVDMTMLCLDHLTDTARMVDHLTDTARMVDHLTDTARMVAYQSERIKAPNLTSDMTYPKVEPEPDIHKLWDLESIGIHDSPAKTDDALAVEAFRNSVERKGSRYWVNWPWKEGKVPSENFGLAQGRFQSLTRRLRQDPKLHLAYDELIKDQLRRGFIEPVDMRIRSDTIKHYIPHHPVFKPSSFTTKMRVVYDASAKSKKEDLSLNDCLLRGPNLMHDLCGILIRFRLEPVALVADIEKAYLQLMLHESQRDVTRFFWLKDSPSSCNLSSPDELFSKDNWIVYRFCRVPFGVISSAFLLHVTLSHHLKTVVSVAREAHKNVRVLPLSVPYQRVSASDVAAKLADNMYVDNVITGAEDLETAKEFYARSKDIYEDASMNIREWCSNSAEFRNFLPEKDRASTDDFKVLGIKWLVEQDQIGICAFWDQTFRDANTKRKVLRVIARIYDPLGLWVPVTFYGKCFLQELWKCSVDWDTVFDDNLQSEWALVADHIQELEQMMIPRLLPMSSTGINSLAVFCDASEKAYACCVYIRRQTGFEWETDLAFAKMRLAPAKGHLTIPRLELMALLIGVRAAKFVQKNLHRPIQETHIFTDSECCLFWIHTTKDLSVFVRNRVKEIRDNDGFQFSHVRTDQNPADLGTRGKSAEELRDCKFWWKGPSWLSKDQNQWPISSFGSTGSGGQQGKLEAYEEASEVVGDPHLLAAEDPAPSRTQGDSSLQQGFSSYLCQSGCSSLAHGVLPFLVDPTDYSDLRKLYRITAWRLKIFLKFIWPLLSEGARSRVFTSLPILEVVIKNIDCTTGIRAQDITAAKMLMDYAVQRSHFKDVFHDLEHGKRNTLIQQLNLVVDGDGILRSHSRYQNAALPDDTKFPKLLPSKSRYTDLVIQDVHRRVLHAGVSHTLAQLRREYWIPKGRATATWVINRCLTCRRLRGPPYQIPRMPPWPRSRVSESAPFTYTGLDYMGPCSTRARDGSVVKTWICLFTCLSTRAIHLETVEDCSAKEFLNGLTRFISRRGTPTQIISDNAPQFKVVQSAIDKAWRNVFFDASVRYYSAERSIRWRFITELAPWQGGFYERLVGIVKNSLRAMIGRKMLPCTELDTLVAEAEAIVNTRPITYVYSDANSWYPLTPNNFLAPISNAAGLPDLDTAGLSREFGDAGKKLIRHWKQRQMNLKEFWEIWRNEYLLSLRNRGGSDHRQPRSQAQRRPLVDEIVLVKDESLPRGAWKLARVTRLLTGQDDAVRSVELVFSNGVTSRRSVGHLYPLELHLRKPPGDQVCGRVIVAGDGASVSNASESHTEDPRVAGDGTLVSNGSESQTEDPGVAVSTDQMEDVPDTDESFYGFTSSDVQDVRDRLAQLGRLDVDSPDGSAQVPSPGISGAISTVSQGTAPGSVPITRAAAARARRLIRDQLEDDAAAFLVCHHEAPGPDGT
jgi:hypothetical protein